MSSSQGPTKQRWRRGPDQSQPSSRDASEEDNDESTEPPTPSSSYISDAPPRTAHFRSTKASAVGMSGDAIARESSLYDGDVESSGASTTGYDAPTPSSANRTSSSLSAVVAPDADEAHDSQPKDPQAPTIAAPPIIELPEEDIRAFVQRALDGETEEGWPTRNFKVNPPATDRPVRIYADGVYDLCHFGHALQMRQAKLSFPSVHLLIGVCSDELCRAHKSLPAMTHAERCASVKHCRWVDEVVPDAPWEITQEFIDRYEIDYVAHDEEPYTSAGKEDVYDFVKKQGRFLPTRRTPGISTSELLERIVSQYRAGVFDGKLEKIGHAELKADRVQWDSAK